MATENPYASPRSDTNASASEPSQSLRLFGVAYKWFRIVLGCAVAASLIAAPIILVQHSRGPLIESLFDLRPRHAGRMILDGPLTSGAIALTILVVTELIRKTRR